MIPRIAYAIGVVIRFVLEVIIFAVCAIVVVVLYATGEILWAMIMTPGLILFPGLIIRHAREFWQRDDDDKHDCARCRHRETMRAHGIDDD